MRSQSTIYPPHFADSGNIGDVAGYVEATPIVSPRVTCVRKDGCFTIIT